MVVKLCPNSQPLAVGAINRELQFSHSRGPQKSRTADEADVNGSNVYDTPLANRWERVANRSRLALLSLDVPAQAWPKKHQKGQEETSPSHDEWRTDISETIIITTVMLIKSSSSSIGGGAAFTHSPASCLWGVETFFMFYLMTAR